MPGILKSSEWLQLAGPIGKWLLEDCCHPEQQTATFEYLDILGSLWEKTITVQQLDKLEAAIPKVLTELSIHLTSWELDMNCHMMLHMVSAIRANRPCSCWSMFGPERVWNSLAG